MQVEDIKRLIRKQLKQQIPNWRRLPKKQKKGIGQAGIGGRSIGQFAGRREVGAHE